MNQPMHFDLPRFRDFSGQFAQDGVRAGEVAQDAIFGYAPAPGDSPFGVVLGTGLGGLQGDLSLAPPQITGGATQTDQNVQTGLSNVEGQDQINAGRARLAKNPGDPESLEQQAREQAKAGAEKPEQMMQQMLQQMMQMAAQTGGQLGQQLGQFTQQFSQLFGQATQQMGQLFSKAGESGAHAVEPALGAAASGLDAAGGAGGGAGGGLGVTMPAGLDGPVTPMTTSSALTPSAIPPVTAAGTSASAAAGRGAMPMMPMMPMAHRGSGEGASVKRDPKIFPQSKIYDPPKGTEQNFGANPEIEAEEPPFGTAKA